MDCYIYVDRNDNYEAVVVVKYGIYSEEFPLIENGCIEAGKFLFSKGYKGWFSSSSVDFPEEVEPSFSGDIRELLRIGFRSGQ